MVAVTEFRVKHVAKDSEIPERLRSPKLPASRSVKLPPTVFVDLWWIHRAEGKEAGEIIAEMIGIELAARRKRYDAKIEKLKRLDEETARIEAHGRAEDQG